MCPGRLQGCTRGVYGLASWEPLRKPQEYSGSQTEQRAEQPRNSPRSTPSSTDSDSNMAARGSQGAPPRRRPILAKYSYKGNKNTPLGKELTVNQKDKLTFIQVHEGNDNWWLAEDSNGDVGYVPANYMMFLDEKSGLPWLANKAAEEDQAQASDMSGENGSYKRYQSSYAHKELKQTDTKEYYCDICEKQLNGPKPYQAHMLSKAHKEEVEFRASES